MGDVVDNSYVKVGPVGSRNGTEWDEKGHTRIVQIFVSHDEEINGIQFQYAESETLLLSDVRGSMEGYRFDAVKLNHPGEYLTWISGYKSSNNNNICSITFGTNKGEHGPYGQFTNKDREFNFYLGEGRQFGGFHGTSDNHTIRSIGVYVKPISSIDYLDMSPIKNSVPGIGVETLHNENWELLNDTEKISRTVDDKHQSRNG